MEEIDRPAGVSSSEVRSQSADYLDFDSRRGRRLRPVAGGRRAAGLPRRRSPAFVGRAQEGPWGQRPFQGNKWPKRII
eukprot:symbB.v1.2.015498.t2/scaffold1160.1/size134679/7